MVYYHEAMLARQGRRFRDLAGATANFRAGHAAGRDSPFWPRRGWHHGVEGDATRFFVTATASSPLGGPESWLLGRVGWRGWPWVAWRQRAFATSCSSTPWCRPRGVNSIFSNTARPSALHMARGGAGRGILALSFLRRSVGPGARTLNFSVFARSNGARAVPRALTPPGGAARTPSTTGRPPVLWEERPG